MQLPQRGDEMVVQQCGQECHESPCTCIAAGQAVERASNNFHPTLSLCKQARAPYPYLQQYAA